MKRICAFCPADAVETGGEHVWDDWINKQLPDAQYHAIKLPSLDSPAIHFTTDGLNEKLPVVCRSCNSGWMSTLSLKVKDRFGRAMLEGEPFSLGARDAAVLAAFTFMKAAATSHAIDSEPFFTRAAREKLRTSLILPPSVKAWFARFQGQARMSTRNNLSVVSTSEPGLLYGMEFCSFTHVVGKLALQLLVPRWKHLNDRGRPLLSLNPNIYWEPATTLFWPHSGRLISWPPEKTLDDDTMRTFIERFYAPVNVPVS